MLDLIKQRLQSKTYIAALVGALITLIEANSGVLSQLVPPEYRAWLMAAWPIGMMALREVTKTALADK